ncbi:MAG: peptide chain release factor N(5)-glutamine methyltransferase [Gordonia sp. (in: high G+C Gram-positive bacteria)]|uniref:peptide chain release factor N(5)-glutamine methyltransferase n=1 Tax=Gordonia sp. (in: high G+C Gram-positive bacteria) TaxID=84139 RepID=UPI003C74D61E
MIDGERLSADALRRATAARLAAAGVESAGADAAELIAQLLEVEPGRLLLIDDVTAEQRERIEAAVQRRLQRIPLQHITTRAFFAGLALTVGPGVFVPRPETELIVEWAVKQLQRMRQGSATPGPIRVVDLCAGSGALGLAIARLVPETEVISVELSDTAADYLQRNIDELGLAARVRLVRADVSDAATMAPLLADADLVVSNPPYVPAAAEVSPEVAHDPPEAVFSGDTGMDLIRAMAPILAGALRPGTPVAIEHDDTTAQQVCDTLVATRRFAEVVAHDDLAGRPRFVTAVHRAEADPAHRGAVGVGRWDA